MEEISNAELLIRLLNEIKKESEQIKKELKDEIQKINGELVNKTNIYFERLDTLEDKLKILESRCVSFDRYTRKNNILIFGLNIPEGVNQIEWVLNRIEELTDINVAKNEVNNIYPIKVGTKKPVKIEFISGWKKKSILNNSHKLKGKNIYFVHDLCYEDRQEQRILRKHLNEARSKKYSARIKGRNLIVNNEIYTVAQLEKQNTEEECIGMDETSSPVQRNQPNSAPQTPTALQAFLEESLCQFSYETNSNKIKKNNTAEDTHKKENKNEGTKQVVKQVVKEGHRKREEKQQKIDTKTEKTVPEQNAECIGKNEDGRKKLDASRERSQITTGLTTRVTRLQSLK